MQRLLVSYKSLKEASLFLQLLRSKPSLRTSLLLLLHLEPGEPPCEGLEFLLELRNLCPLVLLRLDVLVKDLVGRVEGREGVREREVLEREKKKRERERRRRRRRRAFTPPVEEEREKEKERERGTLSFS